MSVGPDGPDVFLDGDIDDVDAADGFHAADAPDGFHAAEAADVVEWLDNEWLDNADEDELASRSGALPAHTTRRRVVSSLLLVGAVLAVTGYGANAVYHRDLAADRATGLVAGTAADELILAAPASRGISLPELGSLGSAADRTERPSTEVAVPVVNLGPAAITLLPGATLLGLGLTASNLGGTTTVLLPGQSTVLRGYVTVDCVRGGNSITGPAAVTSLMISARTSGGGLGVSTVAFADAAGSVRDRVCAARDGA